VVLPTLLATAVAATPLPATPSIAVPGHTPREALERLFDVEGRSPYRSPYAGTLVFSALESKYDSGHGHGYRNELKIAARLRRTAAHTREHFSARVTPVLPDGARSIVAQYHMDGLDTILKVYVQDTASGQGLDGKAGNGLFDILVRMRGTDGRETATALGTVRSGESFDLDIRFAAGDARVMVNGEGAGGMVRMARAFIQPGERGIYFKFGDYLQALDPATGRHTTSADRWDSYYRQYRIGSSRIRFSHTLFEREGEQP
jgi:hypothetical protein